ncbi:hypothetical protein ACFZAR_38420 [Streptomyces sp. NPDC008222]|uniref:hypothetical protein n=1 Tax=Streptomyces sp. NPDC008222 TaxID=3364820 RepID=UPI0036E04CEC
MVFVHGFLDDQYVRDGVAAEPKTSGMERVTLDLAGCGDRTEADGPFDCGSPGGDPEGSGPQSGRRTGMPSSTLRRGPGGQNTWAKQPRATAGESTASDTAMGGLGMFIAVLPCSVDGSQAITHEPLNGVVRVLRRVRHRGRSIRHRLLWADSLRQLADPGAARRFGTVVGLRYCLHR